ncbi:MAG: ATP-binding protein [Candidatus Methanomethylophilaceae archaeon]|nr:ATP-binding protein [Candidatus Methanomethylophilaceae archaeon]
MEFKRKIYNELLEWKSYSKGRSAVMVQGARRVGKSTIVEKFAKNEYKSYIMIDFVETDDEMRRIFTDYKTDLNMLFNRIQLKTNTKLYERKSVIVFDEVQAFPLAREMIKKLVKDGRYDYIETESFISVKSKIADIRIPSEEHKINMHPMDFEEWLWANGDDVTVDVLRELMEKMEPLGESSHKAVLRKYIEYMIIGGMPQVVSTYLEHHDLMETEQMKRDILDLYRDDIHKIPGVSMERALNLFNSIPAILSSPHKVLSPTKVEKGTRRREYDGAIEWLCDAKIFNRCRCSSDPSIAIGLSENVRRVKCYFLDTGLLVSLAFQNDKNGLAETYGLLLDGKLSVNKGMLFENMVAQELICRGYELWFTEFDKKDSNRKYEVDFILPGRNGIIPIEVKSGKSTPHSSLDKMIEKYNDRIVKTFVIHSKDLKTEGGIVYVPIYMMQAMSWN